MDQFTPLGNRIVPIVPVKVKRLDGAKDFILPNYVTGGAAAVDLYAATEDPFIILWPGKRILISSGIAIALPEGYEATIRPRSGLALNKGLSIVNSPGTIDSDYRGPVGIILINHGEEKVKIDRGERIAQMVITPVYRLEWVEGELCETDRGLGGFGSTGK